MNEWMARVRRFVREESGQDLLEYALIAGLLGLGTIASTKTLANKIGGAFTAIGNTITSDV